jgi:hypothetical protein
MLNSLLALPPFLYLVFAFVALLLVVAWILLPVILMSTNAHLRRVLREQQRTNELLEAMRPVRRVESTDIPSLRVEPRDK